MRKYPQIALSWLLYVAGCALIKILERVPDHDNEEPGRVWQAIYDAYQWCMATSCDLDEWDALWCTVGSDDLD